MGNAAASDAYESTPIPLATFARGRTNEALRLKHSARARHGGPEQE